MNDNNSNIEQQGITGFAQLCHDNTDVLQAFLLALGECAKTEEIEHSGDDVNWRPAILARGVIDGGFDLLEDRGIQTRLKPPSIFCQPFAAVLKWIDKTMWSDNDDLCTPSVFVETEWCVLMKDKMKRIYKFEPSDEFIIDALLPVIYRWDANDWEVTVRPGRMIDLGCGSEGDRQIPGADLLDMCYTDAEDPDGTEHDGVRIYSSLQQVPDGMYSLIHARYSFGWWNEKEFARETARIATPIATCVIYDAFTLLQRFNDPTDYTKTPEEQVAKYNAYLAELFESGGWKVMSEFHLTDSYFYADGSEADELPAGSYEVYVGGVMLLERGDY